MEGAAIGPRDGRCKICQKWISSCFGREKHRRRLMNVEEIARRVCAEFDEMPGMMLTLPQASRLFGLDRDLTQSIVDKLVATDHLRRTVDGAVIRATR
jgi:hypothetical protein